MPSIDTKKTPVQPSPGEMSQKAVSTNQRAAATPQPPTPSQVEEDEWLVSCRCESARAVSTLLSCLRYVSSGNASGEPANAVNTSISGTARDMSLTQSRRRSSSAASSIQPVTVFCSPTSLTFHVYGRAKQIQASVDMQAGLFSDYKVSRGAGNPAHENHPDDPENQQEDWQAGGEFCVNLTTVLECLHVLGTNLEKTKLCFSYNLTTDIFKMELLEESGVLSTAAIPGMLPPEDDLGNSLALAFRSSPIAARMIVKSETLREVMFELELVPGATCGTVALGSDGLEMAVVGHLGECLISVPSKGNHVVSIEVQSAVQTAPACTYPLHSLLGSMRGLEIAEETCITMNNNGMMAIQHQVLDAQVGDGNPNFVDFIMCCYEEEEDEDEEEDQGTTRKEQSRPLSESSPATSQTASQQHQASSKRGARKQKSRHDPTPQGVDKAKDEDEDQDAELASISAAPLFGRLVGDSSRESRSSSRSVRRRMRRPLSNHDRHASTEDDGDSDNASRSLLDDDEEETEPLDVTAPVSPRQSRTREECSSPELVYGRQH